MTYSQAAKRYGESFRHYCKLAMEHFQEPDTKEFLDWFNKDIIPRWAK